ncbi:hypothetical protein P389DRAFT_67565 [Cystobasidium minutum MCA 4210]|uniref:uncharacterized protein n=1 Tax=Cystobasidium minutum MCA 4210 TaxID=1397322 RepID=UPI0034CF5D1D|eukprot:jgi/Rhomi1/67565/CE67564_3121
MSASATVPFTAAHRSYVKTLYRRALKDALDWYVRRDLWRNRAIEIRATFEQHRDVQDPRRVATLLQQVEKNFLKRQHPDPYRPPMFPDGTKWERNIPPRIFTEEEKRAALEAHH